VSITVYPGHYKDKSTF